MKSPVSSEMNKLLRLRSTAARFAKHHEYDPMRDASPAPLCLGDGLFNANGSLLADKSGRVIPLRPQSVEVLKALAAQEGAVVSKEDLLAQVWGNVAVTDDSLTQCIADIRRAIGDRDHRIVQTVPKKGYRLVADAPPSRPPRTRWALAAGLAAALPLALLGAWHVSRTAVDDVGQAQTMIASEVTRAEPSIAVLPFESIEGQDRWTRLGRGLAADIASELALNDWLYVTVPESLINVAFGSLPEGRQLDVRFALSGTIQAQGDEIRISAHLTDVSTRKVLWSGTWTEPQNDIFAVQDRIVSRIGASLASSYSGAVVQADLERAKRKLTGNLDAYEHYLIAFEIFHRFEVGDLSGGDQASRGCPQDRPGFCRRPRDPVRGAKKSGLIGKGRRSASLAGGKSGLGLSSLCHRSEQS